MATFNGSAGIAALREKINMKSKLLVGESVERITTALVDDSPVGVEIYPSKVGDIPNDAGDYKNSWVIGLGHVDRSTRAADTTGAGAVADAMIKSKLYNLEDSVYITNSVDHASEVEYGWSDNPVMGWNAKGGYHVVQNNIPTALATMAAVAMKVSKL